MYERTRWTTGLRALVLAGLLTASPIASAVTRDGGFSFAAWLQRLFTSIVTKASITQTDQPCTCDTNGASACGSLHIPGG
jgi:hypothetical protein